MSLECFSIHPFGSGRLLHRIQHDAVQEEGSKHGAHIGVALLDKVLQDLLMLQRPISPVLLLVLLADQCSQFLLKLFDLVNP